MRELVRGLDASMPIFNVRTMEEFYRLRTVSIFNIIIGLIAAMGVMGLALSIVGLYGLVAYGATRRTREIGIRMAIGADRPAVLRMVLRQGVILATVGLVVGLGFGLLARRGLAAAFPGGRPENTGFDFVAFTLVALSVLAATIVAAYIPARRASHINPTEALRYE
jgi:ABC-type antimicrobial peptide transport system permease subunit